ncbi:hypothetical protein XANCAGTX0491_009291 [Xanthoria calcicola]
MPSNEHGAAIINCLFASGNLSFPAREELEDHTCYICQEEYMIGVTWDITQEIPVRIICGHVFGMTCLLRWTLNQTDADTYPHCPVCRNIYCYTRVITVPSSPVAASNSSQDDSSEEDVAQHRQAMDGRHRGGATRRPAPMITASPANSSQEGDEADASSDPDLIPADGYINYNSPSPHNQSAIMDNDPPFRLPSPAVSYSPPFDPLSPINTPLSAPRPPRLTDADIFYNESQWIHRAEHLWDVFINHITSSDVLDPDLPHRDLLARAQAVELLLSFTDVSDFYDVYDRGDWPVDPAEREWWGAPFETLLRFLDTAAGGAAMRNEGTWTRHFDAERDRVLQRSWERCRRRMGYYWRSVRLGMVRAHRVMRAEFEMEI